MSDNALWILLLEGSSTFTILMILDGVSCERESDGAILADPSKNTLTFSPSGGLENLFRTTYFLESPGKSFRIDSRS